MSAEFLPKGRRVKDLGGVGAVNPGAGWLSRRGWTGMSWTLVQQRGRQMLESTPSARKRSWVSRDLGCSGRGEAGITGMGNTWLPCWPEAPPPRLSVYSLADDTFLANPILTKATATSSLSRSTSVWQLVSGAVPGIGNWVLTLRLWESWAASIPRSLSGSWQDSVPPVSLPRNCPRYSMLHHTYIAACFLKVCKPRWQLSVPIRQKSQFFVTSSWNWHPLCLILVIRSKLLAYTQGEGITQKHKYHKVGLLVTF